MIGRCRLNISFMRKSGCRQFRVLWQLWDHLAPRHLQLSILSCGQNLVLWLQTAFVWDWEIQSIFSMAMCSAKYGWSYYWRKRGKQTLRTTDTFATCTHTKEKTPSSDDILQNNNLKDSSFGEAVFVGLHFFHLPKHKSPTSISCFRVWGHVFLRASTAWQAHLTEGLGAGFCYSRMYLIFPTFSQLWALGSFDNNLFINNH